jgi:hypothetical protein
MEPKINKRIATITIQPSAVRITHSYSGFSRSKGHIQTRNPSGRCLVDFVVEGTRLADVIRDKSSASAEGTKY